MRADDLDGERTVYRATGRFNDALHLHKGCAGLRGVKHRTAVAGVQFDDKPVCENCEHYERTGLWRHREANGGEDSDLKERLLDMDADEVP